MVRLNLDLIACAQVLELRVPAVVVFVVLEGLGFPGCIRERIDVSKSRVRRRERPTIHDEMPDRHDAETGRAFDIVILLQGYSFAAKTNEPFDVKLILLRDTGARSREDDDFATLGFSEVIRHPVNEQMIPSLGLEADYLFAFLVWLIESQASARTQFLLPKVRRKPNNMGLTTDLERLPDIPNLDPVRRSDWFEPAIGAGRDVDIAYSLKPFTHASQAGGDFEIRLVDEILRGHAEQSWLHRAGRNLEWLQKKGAYSHRHRQRDQQDLDILAPSRVGIRLEP